MFSKSLSFANYFGIPTLDSDFQPRDLPLPFEPWGSKSRSASTFGSYHFYVEDSKFEALWKSPEKILKTGVTCVVEPNFTITADSPRAFAIWQIYRKRSLSVFWQQHGIDIFVDLNVPDSFLDICLLGVPLGWRSFSTRGYADLPDSDLLDKWHIAQEHSSLKKPLFIVYAGGKRSQQLAARYGWKYFDTYRGS